jgi:transcriptional regulator with XRE-family HTH domain
MAEVQRLTADLTDTKGTIQVFDPTNLKALGLRIRELRRERGLTQEELAARAGLHSRDISRLELGGANFGVSVLFDVGKGLYVSPDKLVSWGWFDFPSLALSHPRGAALY